MIDLLEVQKILSRLRYRNWSFEAEERAHELFVRVSFPAADLVSGREEQQHGRRWLVSRHSTVSEVIQTAFLAVKTAEEHELREQFRYRGRMIFGPHFDAEALHEIAHRLDVRKEPV